VETVDRRALPIVPTAPTAATAAVSILQRFPNSTPKGDTFQLNTTVLLARSYVSAPPNDLRSPSACSRRALKVVRTR